MADRAGVAVVKGGGGLLGRGLVLRFAKTGMSVVVADLNLQTAKDVANEITELGFFRWRGRRST